MENILILIVMAIVAGWLAKMVVPGEGPGGILGDFVVGILGALAGGFIFKNSLGYTYGGIFGSIIVAFIGGVVLLGIFRMISRKPLTK
jgi:uncharacterized membrane protein YeaQ/YmgE (transglycosylase-associated protein family)